MYGRVIWGSIFLVLSVCLCPTAAEAQGGPPLETDDPGTPGNGRWELNTALTLERTAAGSSYEVPVADLNRGVGERIQLNLELPLVLERGAERTLGLGNPGVAVKWRFIETAGSSLGISAYPRLEFQSPVLRARGADDEGGVLLPVEVAAAWETLGVNTELGYRIVWGGVDELIYRLALGYQQSRTLELLSECSGTSLAQGSATELVCQAGARKDLTPSLTLLASIGTAVAGNTGLRTDLRMYLGLQSRW
jgi:hypothetical protein